MASYRSQRFALYHRSVTITHRLLLFLLVLLAAACSDSPTQPSTSTVKITSIAPATGSTTGGTLITITGASFGSDTTVTIGGVATTSVRVMSSTLLTAVLGPRSNAGTGDVIVTSGGQTASLEGLFRYFAPSGTNLPPVVTAIRSTASKPNQPSGFGEVNETVTLVPTVQNNEAATLQYEWSGPGTFTTATDGSTVWRLPSPSATPATVTASLTVTELYLEIGIEHRHQSAPTSFALQLHDSRREVLDMGEDFLTRFTRQLPPEQTLHNFSRTCDDGRGRSEEERDIELNRARYIENFEAFRISRRTPFTVNFKSFCQPPDKPLQLNTDACGSLAVHWEGFDRELGANFVTNGINYISAVVENNQWRLCHSAFVGTETFPALGITRAVSW